MELFGCSFYTVLSGSMERELPRGSLIAVRRTDHGDIRTGDDISFYTDGRATTTHRVIRVIQNYEARGVTAFETQGVENPRPDAAFVRAASADTSAVMLAFRFLFEVEGA
jgi:signal peptidase